MEKVKITRTPNPSNWICPTYDVKEGALSFSNKNIKKTGKVKSEIKKRRKSERQRKKKGRKQNLLRE